MLDPRRLLTLRAVVRAGSMTAAAAELGYTPSAVSQQVAALERETATPLLVRHARGVLPTEAGALLVEHADVVANRLARAAEEVADLTALRAGRLRLASFASAGARLLPSAIGAFRRRHPAVRLSLELREPDECPDLLRDGDLDLAITFGYVPGPGLDTEGLTATFLSDDVVNVALPAGDPALEGTFTPTDEIDVSTLRDAAWIRDAGSLCREQLVDMCATAGFTPNIAFDSDDFPMVSGLVESGVGVALVPDLAVHQMGRRVVLRRLRPRVVRRIEALTLPHPTPATAAMLDVLRSRRAT
ncbi:LysR family transcriptional regulator [Actinomycetospora termitidis]|uniref:LysR substrate-binding domain-containing protein n=1 Tax=Actinomycetospora termitidis TaxID=3053470 RepID=A0ABT7MAQ6_9PSEU|nr:LysR substrate-binding domain-containing protein [Actinomycetospora sp. Odt1-22]MDL5157745.1 LysR substrate-binding domain-containing protein [Actinomycetospora sp. Odt1-22]